LDNYAKTILDELQSSVLRGDKDIGELVVRRIGWSRKDKLTIRLGRESQG
jgi:Holliday junction resolvase RusA-like endonuclease